MQEKFSTRKKRPAIIPVGPSIAYIKLTQGMYSLVDSCDAESLALHNWYAWFDRKLGSHYAIRSVRMIGKPSSERMHSRLVAPEGGQLVDHNNGNTLDNRRSCNLRTCTPSENQANRKLNKNNKSGFQGVRQCRNPGRWHARITFRGKEVNVGVYDSPELANMAREKKKEELFGEFSGNLRRK